MNEPEPTIAEQLAGRWPRIVVMVWLALSVWLVTTHWSSIHWLALGDTDDNLRLQQVRDWLSGQGWYDLRQYRLNAPFGADIHWSRLVDLPIAGLFLLAHLFVDVPTAERFAVAIAPLLPLGAMMLALSIAVRRTIHPLAHLIVVGCVGASPLLMGNFVPLRIDHHGWQLAMVALAMLGLTDAQKVRGGVVTGLAFALSFVIGIEMLPYLAVAGAAMILSWVAYDAEAPRLRNFGAMLVLAIGLGFALFTSEANRAPRCDALTPVWLSVLLAAGALAALLGSLRLADWRARLGAAAIAGLLLALGYAWLWPHCLSNLEAISPEARRLWLDNIREVRPIYRQSLLISVTMTLIAVTGLLGHLLMIWRARGRPIIVPIATIAAMALAADLMLLWQARAAAVAAMLALPGIAALACVGLPLIPGKPPRIATILAGFVLFLVASGFGARLIVQAWPSEAKKPKISVADKADRRCSTMPSHAPLNRVPAGKMFTFVDLAPRLIVLTHHSAITGPYHRNHRLIVDVYQTFRAAPDQARATIMRHHADYVLICPGSSESTLHLRDAPDGFYARLAKGRALEWLEPVALPKQSPFRLWKVLPARQQNAMLPLDVAEKSPTSLPR